MNCSHFQEDIPAIEDITPPDQHIELSPSTPIILSQQSDQASPACSVGTHRRLDMESVSSEDSTAPVFEIPNMWRPSIMTCIKERHLTIEARNEIVRNHCTHMYPNMKSDRDKPTTKFCREVTQKLVKKYPFMADSGGGVLAYVRNVYDCVFILF